MRPPAACQNMMAGAAAERENVPDSSAWNETGGDEIVVGREFHPEFVVGQERDRQARSDPNPFLSPIRMSESRQEG